MKTVPPPWFVSHETTKFNDKQICPMSWFLFQATTYLLNQGKYIKPLNLISGFIYP